MRHLHVAYPHHLVILQETHSTPEVEVTWENEWGSKVLFSHGTQHQSGVAALFPRTFTGKVTNEYADDDGRMIWVEIICGNDRFAIVGVYAPAVDLQSEKIAFLEKLREELIGLTANNIVLCGDFNVHMGELDTEPGKFRASGAGRKLFEIAEELCVKDIWRYMNPNSRGYTWRRVEPMQQSRLDYIFVSETVCKDFIITCNIAPGIKSDHSLVEFTAISANRKRGPGLWRFNNDLLEDAEFTVAVKQEIANANSNMGIYQGDLRPGLVVEMLLSSIRVICIKRSKVIARERRFDEQQAVKMVAELETDLSMLSAEQKITYEECKCRLDELKTKRAKNAIMQSSAKWIEEGEKVTKYFLSRGKQLSAQKVITELQAADQTICGDRSILDFCVKHYSEAFRSKSVDMSRVKQFLDSDKIPKLSEDEQIQCEGLITGEECKRALDRMNSNKTPGITGFTVEFFKAFWSDLEGLIVAYINAAPDENLFISQRRGVITLIPKKGQQDTLDNKRPICLLDVLYKIVAKVCAIRLGRVIDKLISTEQTGFIKGRFIGENLRLISDMIEYCETDRIPGIMIACDYKAAFDSLEHEFMFAALKAYNFGENFIKWIKVLYSDFKLAIINNGYTSEWFRCSRGTFQGSPISGMLFALAVEILAVNLREDDNFHGITVSDRENKLSLYADDITVFASNARSAERALQIIGEFSDASGLCLNINKSKIMWLGTAKGNLQPIGGIAATDKIKILGLWFSAKNSCVDDNVGGICQKIEAVINVWSQRNLTIKGCITITKSLLASQLVYACSCIQIPRVYLRRIQSKLMKFVWRGRPPKVAKKVLIQSIDRGGLNAIDVEMFCQSLHMGWIRRMQMSTNSAWRKILQARMGRYDITDWLKTPLDRRQINQLLIPEFYKHILRNVQRFVVRPIDEASNVRKEMLWHNRSIRISLKPVFIWDMYSAGIKMVDDLLRPNGTFLSVGELRNKFPGVRVDFLRYEGLIRAIPRLWKYKVAGEPAGFLTPTERNAPVTLQFPGKPRKLTDVRCRDFYHAELERVQPKAVSRWEEEGYSSINWADTFKIPYICTKSTRLQSLQYRVLHRYLPTRRFLFQRNVIDSQGCLACGATDTIAHFLYDCIAVKPLWDTVFRALNVVTDDARKDAIFGIVDARHAINVIIILIKQYVVSCKLATQAVEPSYPGLKGAIKNYIDSERIIARNNDKIEEFERKWHDILVDREQVG